MESKLIEIMCCRNPQIWMGLMDRWKIIRGAISISYHLLSISLMNKEKSTNLIINYLFENGGNQIFTKNCIPF